MMIKSYLITDPSLFGNTPETLIASVAEAIKQYDPDFICLRDKSSENYAELAKAFLSLEGDHKAFLHSDVDLAVSLGAFGVHLSSFQFDDIRRAKRAGLYVIASTHSYEEAVQAKEADAITYSPIFFSPNKGIPKGLEDLKEITGKINTNIFALGGITTKEQIEQVETCGVYGFASIRYFAQDALL
ncbi:thiamine phosphate synthase [Campylobacterota bacterium]